MMSSQETYYLIGEPTLITSACGAFAFKPTKQILRKSFDALPEGSILIYQDKEQAIKDIDENQKKLGQFKNTFGNYLQRPIFTVYVNNSNLMESKMREDGSELALYTDKSNLTPVHAEIVLTQWGNKLVRTMVIANENLFAHPPVDESNCAIS